MQVDSHWAMRLDGLLWWLMLGVWFALWTRSKKDKLHELPWQRVLHVVPVIFGFWLLFGSLTPWVFLNVLFPPPNALLPWIGLSVTALGVGIAIWARFSLGANWSSVVTLKKDHELIRAGLYRRIRHPIYTGILVAAFGTALIRCQLRGWIGVAVVFLSFYIKARREESFLRQEFGAGFEEHARNTGMFFPRVS